MQSVPSVTVRNFVPEYSSMQLNVPIAGVVVAEVVVVSVVVCDDVSVVVVVGVEVGVVPGKHA